MKISQSLFRPASVSPMVRPMTCLFATLLLMVGAGMVTTLASAAADAPRGPYFGQKPPATTPTVFAPGIVSLDDRYEYVITFSPDGTECCFGVTDSRWSTCDLYCSKQERGIWSKPEKADFQQGGDGWLPFFSSDGERFLFSSGRPSLESSNTYICERTAAGWGPPRKLGAPVNSSTFDWRPNEAADGTLYFSSDRSGGAGQMDIYRALPRDGDHLPVENLGPPVNTPQHEASPYISADERFLTFERWAPDGYGKADLYISYRLDDGSWTEPQNLGPAINTEQIDDGGSISPDGKYFFFNRRRDWVTEEQTDIYWVDIRVILRPYVVNPAGTARAVVGKNFILRLPPEQFADDDDASLTYAASSANGEPLPSWLVFDAEARTLSGTPGAAGEVAVAITATDAVGSTCRDVVTIHIDG